MRKFTKLFTLFFTLILCLGMTDLAWADDGNTNPETGYEVWIEDNAGLLTSEEISALAEKMDPITEYGNVGFYTTDSNSSSTAALAKEIEQGRWGSSSGTLFVIDMDNRMIYIHSDGYIYSVITNSYADTITDNVYTYASNAEYFNCAFKSPSLSDY